MTPPGARARGEGVVGPRCRRRSRLQAAVTAAGATAPHGNQLQNHATSTNKARPGGQEVTKRRLGRAVTRPTPRRNGAVTFGLFASGDAESEGPHLTSSGELEAQTLSAAIGRRSLLRAASALAAAGVVGPAVLAGSADAAPTAARPPGTFPVLQPGVGAPGAPTCVPPRRLSAGASCRTGRASPLRCCPPGAS